LAETSNKFLDEINSVSLNLQAKLLRVLEEKEIMRIGSDYVIPLDVRIISAANESLKSKIAEGSFRRDLFYRLSILELYIPPLRERKMDIIPIFKHYLSKFSGAPDYPIIRREFEEKIMNYPWPGNVRELRNIAQRYIIFGEVNLDESEIIEEHNELIGDNVKLSSEIGIDLKEINRYVEEKVIDMLTGQGMPKNEIAKLLGISRTSLWHKQNANNDKRPKNKT
jgi:propionate catabolism operon transcriptional regulator